MSDNTQGFEKEARQDENRLSDPSQGPVGETNLGVINQANNLAENTKLLNSIWKMAGIYSKSSMIPTNYQGKPENCFVAIELAGRMGVSPTLVMQNLTVVQGRPTWNGQSCIALINGCGKFSHDLDFVVTGIPGTDDWGCYCETKRRADGKELKGVEITMKMAQEEGWSTKNGSKWKTMPGQMLMYRAAAFFARAYCPEILMGFSTSDEVDYERSI
jgi:hypothetical protein